jgi:hypothetical protein
MIKRFWIKLVNLFKKQTNKGNMEARDAYRKLVNRVVSAVKLKNVKNTRKYFIWTMSRDGANVLGRWSDEPVSAAAPVSRDSRIYKQEGGQQFEACGPDVFTGAATSVSVAAGTVSAAAPEAVTGLSSRVDRLESRVTDLEGRIERAAGELDG